MRTLFSKIVSVFLLIAGFAVNADPIYVYTQYSGEDTYYSGGEEAYYGEGTGGAYQGVDWQGTEEAYLNVKVYNESTSHYLSDPTLADGGYTWECDFPSGSAAFDYEYAHAENDGVDDGNGNPLNAKLTAEEMEYCTSVYLGPVQTGEVQ